MQVKSNTYETSNQNVDFFIYPNYHHNRRLRAILRIATSSPELIMKFCPHIDLVRQEVLWDAVFNEQFGAVELAAINVAYAICTGETSSRCISLYDLNGRMALPVLEALSIAMGLDAHG